MSGLRYVDDPLVTVSGQFPLSHCDFSFDDLADLRGIDVTAHLAQDWAPKRWECRVVVVGEEIFVIAIHAGSARSFADWRSDYPAITDSLIRLLAQGSHR